MQSNRGFKIFYSLILALFLFLSLSAHAEDSATMPQASVFNVHMFGDQEQTRFVIDLSQKLPYSVIYLDKPNRIVIELPEVDYQLSGLNEAEGIGLIDRYRFGLFLGGKSRFILDLNTPSQIFSIDVLEPNSSGITKLVIDLKQITEEKYTEIVARSRAERKALTQAQASNIAPAPNRQNDDRFVVIIDPGHGGIDGGAIGGRGTREKDVVLEASKALAQSLKAYQGIEVHLTRDRDVFIPLNKRVSIARSKHADLFISMHADAFRQASVKGATVYTLSKTASDKQAGIIAQSENRSDIVAGADLDEQPDLVSSILIDLMVRETKAFSKLFAGLTIDKMGRVTKLHSGRPRSANFIVLRAPDIPSVLVELGYISNPDDEKKLRDSAWRSKIADILAKGIVEYGKKTGQI